MLCKISPRHVKVSPVAGTSRQTSAGQTAYLMSEETRRAAKLSSGRFWQSSSGQLCLASPACVVCDGWLRQVSKRRVGAGARRQGVKVQENNNHQKSRRNSWKRREGGGCCRCFRDQFCTFEVSLLSVLQFSLFGLSQKPHKTEI